ncbi:MAG: hypothetical protein M3176_09305 [Chloroflexota bacterium]|nr:hypothetical protein [Chloroflexota bacterium]
MRCARRFSAVSVVMAMILACLLPATVFADGGLLGGGVSVTVGGSGGPVNGGVNVGGGGVNVGVTVGGGNGNGGGSVATVNGGVSVGGGSVANGGASATVGGGSVATAGGGATVGGGSVANGGAGATVGGGGSVANGGAGATVGGGNNGNGNGGDPIVSAGAGAGVGNTPNGSLVGVAGCVEVGGNCNGTTATAGAPGAPVIGVGACVVVDGSCNAPASPPPAIGVGACVAVDGNCSAPPTTVSAGGAPIVGVGACVVADGSCTTPPTTAPVGGTACVALDGSCNGPTTPTGTGIGIGGTGTTPVGGVGACVIILDSCGGVPVSGGPTGGPVFGGPTGAPIPGGSTPGGPITGGPTLGGSTGSPFPGAPITISVTGDGNALTTATANMPANAQDNANPALCAIPLTAFSKDATMTGTLVDCASVHVAGSRSLLPAGYGLTEDSATAGATTKALGGSGRVLTDIAGTCAGCETAFGSGSGYRSFVQLKDQASGDFINVGLVHEASAAGTGEHNTGGMTLMIQTGRKTATGYNVSQGFIATDANRVPGGHATILLAWNAQGVTVSVNGVVLPNESAPRAATVGTYVVNMTQPVISFAANAKNPGERVDTTFKSIAFAG